MCDELNIPNFDDFEKTLVQISETTSKSYYINLDSDIYLPHYYRKVYEVLENANECDTITFRINTGGGYLSTVVQFYHFMLKTNATTIAEVNVAYSAGADISLCCDEIIITELSTMMFHSGSYVEFGKPHEISSSWECQKKLANIIYDKIYSGFLTIQEINRIKKGEDIWLTSNSIAKRAKKRNLIR